MISIKRWVKEFFGLSHSQANGFIILIPLLALILFSEPIWKWYAGRKKYDFSADQAKLDSLITIWEKDSVESLHHQANESLVRERFYFNPNQTTEEQWLRLGFSKTLSKRLIRYRDKGGKFKVKSDLLKIYGMDSSLYQNLYAFIDLPVKIESGKRDGNQATRKYDTQRASSVKSLERFDLNTADTSQLKKINGIGVKLSLRIIKYREALGGFVRMEQLSEIYGLDTAVVSRLSRRSFIMTDFRPSQLNLNTVEESRLAAHPYFKKEAARSIVAYRFQHGRFQTMSDLRKIHVIDEQTFQKITPYLNVDE